MRHFPSTRNHPQLAGLSHSRAPRPLAHASYWFALGFFSALLLAGYVAGIFHWPN